MTDPVEQARESAVDALVDWSILPPGSGHNVRDILDDFEEAIRTAAIAEAEARLEQARTALEFIAADDSGLACADDPFCSGGRGYDGHARDCAVQVAGAALAALKETA